MITCEFLGRLGNNLFQAATVIGLAEKHGSDYVLPIGYRHKQIYRDFPNFKYGTRLHLPTVEENGFGFQDISVASGGVCLKGFFQSEKYFIHCRDRILRLLNFKRDPVDAVSIHVRRGDFVTTHAELLPPVSENYLNAAVDYFTQRGAKQFFVFSDDIQWCRQFWRANSLVRLFNIPDEFEALSLMSSCQHHIISNSTFGWWGAWANTNPDKIVIAPKVWFGPKQNLTDKDICPQSWIRM